MASTWPTTSQRTPGRRWLMWFWVTPLCASVGYASYRTGYAVMTLLFAVE